MDEHTSMYPPGRGSQLTDAERAEIQHLSLIDDIGPVEIARKVCRDRETVRNVLIAPDTQALKAQLATEARDQAMQTLQRKAHRAVEAWGVAIEVAKDRGDHRPAKDLLLHTGAIPPIANDHGNGSRVAIIIGMPGHPVAADPGAMVIQVSGGTVTEPETES